MKKALYVITLFVLLLPRLVLSDNKIEIITFVYPPYFNGDGSGFLERIVMEAFRETNTVVEFEYFPPKRAILYYKSSHGHDKIFLGGFIQLGDENKDRYIYEKFISYRAVFAYNKKENPGFKFNSLNYLKGKRIGVSLGSRDGKILSDNGLTVEPASLELHLNKLRFLRIDLVSGIDLALMNQIDSLFTDKKDIFGLTRPWDYRAGGLIFYKENREGAELFEKGFRKIYESGRYHEILESIYGKGKVPEDAKVKLK
jgi:hypothetical protein